MSDLFTIEWEKCPNGYKIINKDELEIVIPKSHRIKIYRPLNIRTEKLAPFHVFADMARTHDGVIDFANNFGLLFKDRFNLVSEFYEYSQTMHSAVQSWHDGNIDDLIGLFDSQIGRWAGQISVTLNKNSEEDQPELRIQSRELLHALWLQFAEAVSTGLCIKHCQWCRKAFPYGPDTGHRNTATYCSPKCQKAHYYRTRQEK